MLKPQLAIGDFKKVLAIEPQNKSVKQQLEATQKLVRRIEFEKVGQPQSLVTLII
jgi:serine/threonine-protein phosphatase 5